MKRAAFAILFVLGFGAGGALSATAVVSATGTTTTGTSTGPPTTTYPTTGTTTTPDFIPPGVSIAGVPVGSLTPAEATADVQESFSRPLAISVAGHTFSVAPSRLGARAKVRQAVERAKRAEPATDVPLVVTVKRSKVRQFVAALAKRFDRKPVDSTLSLRKLRPWLSKPRPGRTLRRAEGERAIVLALQRNSRARLLLRSEAISPEVTRRNFGPVIVIRRGSNHLFLYRGMRYWRAFGVATGQRVYPTPLGRFTVVVKWKNPWWYPPDSPWAKGQDPIPPGPGNPLGTRWMGLSAPGVGIHGTPDDASIGYSVSHGCIRMHISDAEWLFNHVEVGTTVFIVSA